MGNTSSLSNGGDEQASTSERSRRLSGGDKLRAVVGFIAKTLVVGEDAPKLRALLGKTWREGFNLPETNYTGGDDGGPAVTHLALRLFRWQ